MSRLAGLARTNSSTDKKDGLTGLSSPSPTTNQSDADASAPSLSALASGAQSRPRQNLAVLGRTSGLTNNGPSLSNLATTRTEADGRGRGGLGGGSSGVSIGAGRPSLRDLAGTTTTAGNARSSLTSLARPQGTPQSSPSASKSPSLAQLANANQTQYQGAPLRRSLVSLASSSASIKKTMPGSSTSSTTTSALSTSGSPLSSGKGLSSAGGLGGLQRASPSSLRSNVSNSSVLTSNASSSLSSLAKASLQQRASPSLSDLSKRSSLSTSGLNDGIKKETRSTSKVQEEPEARPDSAASAPTSTYTQLSTTVQASLEHPTTRPTSTTEPHPDMGLHMDGIMDSQDHSTMPFSSLIAAPSHFAVSIFEKLEPVPDPMAVSLTSIMQSGLGGHNPTATTTTASPLMSLGVVTPARVFQFDVPSPDDIVFKAHRQRSTATRT
ncbi:hypothetical protein BG011_000225 [Mortierella polycephala]|uniref:Uncharacterized protein n=1 Tax=Mortierella polycephala TaxID=41804 RepID=A0A9P6TVS8_9FUNG|nr:hypothetical protein BG011_000225 [Mortierella polycephala]